MEEQHKLKIINENRRRVGRGGRTEGASGGEVDRGRNEAL